MPSWCSFRLPTGTVHDDRAGCPIPTVSRYDDGHAACIGRRTYSRPGLGVASVLRMTRGGGTRAVMGMDWPMAVPWPRMEPLKPLEPFGGDMARKTGTPARLLMMIAVLAVTAAAVYCWIWEPNRPVDVSRLTVSLSESDRFTRRQLDDAVKAVLGSTSDYHGCSIDAISYDEARSDATLDYEKESIEHTPGSYSTVYGAGIARYGVDGMAVFRTDVTCGDSAYGMGLSPGHSGWSVFLAYDPDSSDASHGWVLIDSGNG